MLLSSGFVPSDGLAIGSFELADDYFEGVLGSVSSLDDGPEALDRRDRSRLDGPRLSDRCFSGAFRVGHSSTGSGIKPSGVVA